ncbi:MAG: DoxX family membrane protein [Gemmatimonadota bacterium]
MNAPWPGIRGLGWERWTELGLGGLFVVAGVVKASGNPFMVQLFASLGFGQWLRYLTAAIEISGGLLLLTGRLQYLAALALAVIMVGATDASIVVFDRSPIPPALTLVALLVVAWMRRPSDDNVRGQ